MNYYDFICDFLLIVRTSDSNHLIASTFTNTLHLTHHYFSNGCYPDQVDYHLSRCNRNTLHRPLRWRRCNSNPPPPDRNIVTKLTGIRCCGGCSGQCATVSTCSSFISVRQRLFERTSSRLQQLRCVDCGYEVAAPDLACCRRITTNALQFSFRMQQVGQAIARASVELTPCMFASS